MSVVSKKRIDVAVAVVFNSAGQVLWGQRPTGKPYAGYWEFPGGKVELGESVWDALVRELQEELGFTAIAGAPWFVIEHDYEHALVRLHLYRVWSYQGQPKAMEGQAFQWAELQPKAISPILPATEPLLPIMAQPKVMAISQVGKIGLVAQLERLDAALAKAPGGIRLQIREPQLQGSSLLEAFSALLGWAKQHNQAVCVNSGSALNLLSSGVKVSELPALHLTENHLMRRPNQLCGLTSVGASVHAEQALTKAFSEKMEYAVLGAVNATQSHPGQAGIGWADFANKVTGARLPVYAVGGLNWSDLCTSHIYGAHGIAMINGL